MTELPTPRLELRWREATEKEVLGRSIFLSHACDYGLVIPVERTDVRSNLQHPDGTEDIGALYEVFYSFSTTLSSEPINDFHAPYRDGTHATWDADKLGGLPIYVRSMTGDLRQMSR